MRYFALGNKANIKITDDSLTLEDVKNDAIKMKIVTPDEADQIREIKRDEFIKPMDEFQQPVSKSTKKAKTNVVEEEETPWGRVLSWQSLIDQLKKEEDDNLSPVEREREKKKKYYGR